jgi:tetratricopeptide (TPR) repeat protein
MPKVGIYALAKNEAKHAAAWAESCADADVRVVTDTGSTDGTQGILVQQGVTVCNGYVCPWRWDDAHNLSLNHLPPDVDIAIRLDLDERILPGWREAVERAWTGEVNNLRYQYAWSLKPDGSPGLVFYCDRVHARHGFRWAQATHEGLMCWTGDKVQAIAEGLEVHHHREPGKVHKSDLTLLRVAVREAPGDARAQWYLAREMSYAGLPEAAAEFLAYLKMPGGQATERAYARRYLYLVTQDERQLHQATEECPGEPDAWEALSLARYRQQRWQECYEFATRAIEAGDPGTHATDPDAKGRAYDLASVSAWELGKRPEALTLARQAATMLPADVRIRQNVAAMERHTDGFVSA